MLHDTSPGGCHNLPPERGPTGDVGQAGDVVEEAPALMPFLLARVRFWIVVKTWLDPATGTPPA